MIMKDKEETVNEESTCEFCNKTFKRFSSIVKHSCEQKRRWLDKDKQPNRIGFQTWLVFYKKNSAAKKTKTYQDFIQSAYYSAFVKFGHYCVEANVINVVKYAEWLVNNNIRLDIWNTDTNYNKFLIEFLRNEDPFDALYRSVETTMDIAKNENIKHSDIFRYSNKNRLCHKITTGKISPWMLYHSESGTKFLESLDETQVRMVLDYINPELWAIKFIKNSDFVKSIKDILKQGGY